MKKGFVIPHTRTKLVESSFSLCYNALYNTEDRTSLVDDEGRNGVCVCVMMSRNILLPILCVSVCNSERVKPTQQSIINENNNKKQNRTSRPFIGVKRGPWIAIGSHTRHHLKDVHIINSHSSRTRLESKR